MIGAGVIGLPIAVMLTQNRFKPHVTLLAAEFSPNITSDRAGAMMRLPEHVASIADPRVNEWFKETYQYFTQLYASSMAAKLDLSLVTHYSIYSERVQDPCQKDLMFGFREIGTEEKKILNISQENYAICYSTFTLPVSPYLMWQMEQFKANGGTVIQRKLNSLKEIDGEYDVVVNCTGLSSKELVGDKELYPVRGQAMLLKAPWVKHLIISGTEGHYTYIIPRKDGALIGGTLQVDNWSTEVDSSDHAGISERCFKYVPSLVHAEVLDEWVGLRPARKQVRLEIEDLSSNTAIVHNYGHGGKGLAFSIGCAKESVMLTEKYLGEKGFYMKSMI